MGKEKGTGWISLRKGLQTISVHSVPQQWKLIANAIELFLCEKSHLAIVLADCSVTYAAANKARNLAKHTASVDLSIDHVFGTQVLRHIDKTSCHQEDKVVFRTLLCHTRARFFENDLKVFQDSIDYSLVVPKTLLLLNHVVVVLINNLHSQAWTDHGHEAGHLKLGLQAILIGNHKVPDPLFEVSGQTQVTEHCVEPVHLRLELIVFGVDRCDEN